MKAFFKRNLRKILFTLGGIAVGGLYYIFFACKSGCPISSNPWTTMAYTGLMGFILSGGFCGCGGGSCSM